MMKLASDFCSFAKKLCHDERLLLHRPVFEGRELNICRDCIKSNFVSSVGQMVVDFEVAVARYTGAKYAIACVNGTTALHMQVYIAWVWIETAM